MLKLATLLAFALLAIPSTALAQPSCGDTLTTSTTLTADLNCPGNALLISRGGSLDMAGHTLSGDGTGFGVAFGLDSNGYVSRGTVTGFNIGVQVGKGATALVSHIKAEYNETGISVFGGAATLEFNHAFWNTGLGIDAHPRDDGGHNKGRHNGDPRQCVGVAC